MSNFTKIRPAVIGTPGAWNPGSTVLNTEFATLDSNLAKAINGDEGGTWDPTSPIVIAGTSGLIVSGPFSTTGSTAIGNESTDTLTVAATSTFNSSVTFSSDVACNQSCEFNGGEFHTGPETHHGEELHTGSVTNTGTTTLTGTTIIGNTSSRFVGYDFSTGALNITATTLSVSGSATFTGDTTLGNAATDTLWVAATTRFSSPVTCSASTLIGNANANNITYTLSTGALGITATTLAVSGNVTLSNYTLISGMLQVTGNNGVILGDITKTSHTLLGDQSFVIDGKYNFIRISVAAMMQQSITLSDANVPGGHMVIIAIDTVCATQTGSYSFIIYSQSSSNQFIAAMRSAASPNNPAVLGLIRNTNVDPGWDIVLSL